MIPFVSFKLGFPLGSIYQFGQGNLLCWSVYFTAEKDTFPLEIVSLFPEAI